MKSLLLTAGLLAAAFANAQTNLQDTSFLQPVEVTAIRATDKTPVAKTNLIKAEIEKNNVGQDLPFILNQTPSIVVNADAGNGIGYTGMRIRGSDASRINITLNGIPYNDAESQGTFLVNLPDIASSAGSIQVQRGVGTSTNGAGAFGGSVNMSTNDIIKEKGMEFNNTYGSYHSFKNTVILNSGIFKNHFTVDARLSQIRSDGYIDRASSRLRSYFASAAYLGTNNSFRVNVFSGREKTYQAWNGIDEMTLQTDRTYNSAGREKPGEPYANETDNYLQTHYQGFFNHKFNKLWKANVAVFLTRGKGYYEQYKGGAKLSAYSLPNLIIGTDTTTKTDLVRRLWLDNYFYGTIFSLQYEQPKTQFIIGGSINKYDGEHYGEITWAQKQAAVPAGYRWYDLDATKTDYAAYTKASQQLGKKFQVFLDLQVRAVNYDINGFRDNPQLVVSNDYLFFNPKAGISFNNKNLRAFLSYGRAAKEPNRDDFESGNAAVKPEKLNDFEAGLEQKAERFSWGMNLYYMQYDDQLVLTGKINDVGAYTRTNIPESYRSGIELQAAATICKWLNAGANLTLSRNKVENFTEYIDDYDNGGQQTKSYKESDLAFSPEMISAIAVNIFPVKNLEINFNGKYVSRQYLDNTSQDSRSLRAFYTQDAKVTYSFKKTSIRELKMFVQANNIFSRKYEPNGYTFSYVYGGQLTTENYYFPMAPINFVAGINIKL
ncbi:MAG: TonB-dependent receptor [Ferruginibacter sp.]|nr:TonB-dependent receptor [Ferruginibacter sp.]